MKTLKRLTTPILALQLFFVAATYSKTLSVSEKGTVLAETNNYSITIENGAITHFHNKLTRETYTQDKFSYSAALQMRKRRLESADAPPIRIRQPSPLTCEITYGNDEADLHLFITIDNKTNDLLIQQRGISRNSGIESTSWVFGHISDTAVDVIAPIKGGQILKHTYGSNYPGGWESQLFILQGQRGGAFIRCEDKSYGFKGFEYEKYQDNSSTIVFASYPHAPFEEQNQFISPIWKINAYQGDWQVPARQYRDWMHEKLQPLDRTQMPSWVDEIKVIIIHSKIEPAILPHLNQLLDAEKTLIYMHAWRHRGHDGDLPNYSASAIKPGFGDFIKEAHRYGFKIMVHVNMVGISPEHPLYTELEKYQLIDPWNNEKKGWYWEDLTNTSRHAYINTASRAYRQMFVEKLKRLQETYNIDAFHLDISTEVENDKNGRIDGLTMAEGNILLHQQLLEAMPGIVLGGESLHEVTFLYESFAQRWWIPPTAEPHPISSFLFSSYTKPYGYFIPNPDRHPDEYQKYIHEYEVWDILLTLRVYDPWDLELDKTEMQKLLQVARERQGWTFGDVNGDSVVNILDLVVVAQNIETQPLVNQRTDVNKDGVVNILDLVLIAKQIG